MHYNYASAKKHDTNYQHPPWLKAISLEEAQDVALWAADTLSYEVGTHPDFDDNELRPPPRTEVDEEDSRPPPEPDKSAEEILNLIGSFVGPDNPYKIDVYPQPPTQARPVCPAGKAATTRLHWLADTGSPYDLMSATALGPNALQLLTKLRFGVTLNTANGPVVVDDTIDMRVKRLKETIHPLVLDDTPIVLSIGLRVMELGYDFIWMRFSRPYFILSLIHI